MLVAGIRREVPLIVVLLLLLLSAAEALAIPTSKQLGSNSASTKVAQASWVPVYTHGAAVTQVGSYKLPAPATFYGLVPPPKTALLVTYGPDTTCFFFVPIRYEETVKGYLLKYPTSVPLQKGTYTTFPNGARVVIPKNQHYTKEHPDPQWFCGADAHLPMGRGVRYTWSFVPFEKETPEEREMDDPFDRATFDALFKPGSPLQNQQWQLCLGLHFYSK